MNIKKPNNIFISLLISTALLAGQLSEGIIPPNTGARYVSGEDGVIRMYVNVWGHVNNPGRILVDEGIDLATLLSLSGGPRKGANYKNIKVYHEYPDKDGIIVHEIDFNEYIKTGDRSNFISIQPNDTFIIKQTPFSYFIEEIGTINTIMSLINVYLNVNNLITK
ncbi:MAG: SLBB domain-containing protein [Candidatus Marinimicrobia bacterium]|jgi:hypothetical protein|nr:SLBB domain-containing protein [Candidatus Neomarinimicrobiota bacterium]